MLPDTAQVFDLFKNHPGEKYSYINVAEKLKMGRATARQLLQELMMKGHIRKTLSSKGRVLYTLVFEAVVEPSPSQLPPFKPLEGYAVEMRRIAASAVAGRR